MQTFPLSKLKDTEHTKAKVDNLITETDRVLKLYPSLWPTPLKKKKRATKSLRKINTINSNLSGGRTQKTYLSPTNSKSGIEYPIGVAQMATYAELVGGRTKV